MNDYNPNFQQPQKQSSNDALLAGAIAAIVGAGLGAGGVAVANTLSDTPEVEVEEETPHLACSKNKYSHFFYLIILITLITLITSTFS